jgi:tRNA A-37 threonylcarbamoyl transferase component Bud32
LVAGRYRLLARIGRGGMGTVWRAQDELLDRLVAVKKLHPPQPHMDDEELATLFERTRREARAAARISHPNVIVVHDVVDDEGLPSIVMEYVESVTLGELLKQRGPLPPAEAARIGRGMIAALRAAHRAGVLHRDVKPGNVLLGNGPEGEIGTGRIVLTDFGIAQASGTSTLTRTGELIGSIDFLSPERIRGAAPGPEADMWALGCTLYQAVEGRSPYRRPTAIETAYAIAEEQPLAAPDAGPLTEVIAGLLAKEPERRTSAEEAERLLRLPASEPDTALVGPDDLATRRLPAQSEAAAQPVPRRPAPAAHGPVITVGGRRPGAAPPPQQPPPSPYDFPSQQGPPPYQARPSYQAPPPRHTGRWVAAALAVAVVAAGVAVAVDRYANRSDTAANGGGTGSPRVTTSAPPAPAPTTDPPTTTASASPDPTTASPTGTPRTPPPVPDDYHLEKQSGRGYSVPVPNGWTKHVKDGGDQVSYVDPTQTVALKISALDYAGVDPYQHWIDLEPQTRSQVDNYHRERMERTVTPSGEDAALWEFTFSGSAAAFRAIDLGFGHVGGREYAIYLSAPKELWSTYKPVWENAVDGFRQDDTADESGDGSAED